MKTLKEIIQAFIFSLGVALMIIFKGILIGMLVGVFSVINYLAIHSTIYAISNEVFVGFKFIKVLTLSAAVTMWIVVLILSYKLIRGNMVTTIIKFLIVGLAFALLCYVMSTLILVI